MCVWGGGVISLSVQKRTAVLGNILFCIYKKIFSVEEHLYSLRKRLSVQG